MALGKTRDHRIGEQLPSCPSGPQASVTMPRAAWRAQSGLLKARVQLDLIDRWSAPPLAFQQLERLEAEVGDADRASGLLPMDPFERVPGAEQPLRLEDRSR